MLIKGHEVEERLIEQLEALRRSPLARTAVHFRFSLLAEAAEWRLEQDIATEVLLEWCREHGATAYRLSNDDLIALCKGVRADQLRELTERLEVLFEDAPRRSAEALDDGRLGIWYDLTVGLGRLIAYCDAVLLERRASAAGAAEQLEIRRKPGVGTKPVTPAAMARLEIALGASDIDRFIRQQPICRVPPGRPYAPIEIGREVYVRIADLEQVMMPGVDLLADCWLFMHLTQQLDQRVLALYLRDPDNLTRQPTALNLRLATVLSPEFGRLVRLLSDAERRRLTIEVEAVDMMADYEGYLFARSYLNDIGVTLCLDGTDGTSLPALTGAGLIADAIKIRWDPAFDTDALADRSSPFAEAVAAFGPHRTVLCWCSDARAIEFGHTLGLTRFQGRYLDQLLTPGTSRLN
ncbi:MAG: hypothetical protein AB7P52_06430 [Alphaproteobacteria bacterium]